MYKYHDPKTVKSPRDKVKSVEVLFDGGENPGYSVAIVDWDGTKGIGIRWNINNREWEDSDKQNGNEICIGEPNSRGHATWFIIPPNLINNILNGLPLPIEDRKKLTDSLVGEILGAHL